MLTIACVLSEGPIYDASHVERLMRQVEGRINQPYRFLCLTNDEVVPCERVSLVTGWPGWWAKLELFRPDLFKMGERVLYLDLDVTIAGDLDDLAAFPAPFAIMNDPNRLGFNSSVMAWDAGSADCLYDDFTPSVMKRLAGDQDWIWEKMGHAAKFPRPWCVSYKHAKLFNHWNEGVFGPDDMRVLVYHGQPKPWDLSDVA